jgi:hypothetical protein
LSASDWSSDVCSSDLQMKGKERDNVFLVGASERIIPTVFALGLIKIKAGDGGDLIARL